MILRSNSYSLTMTRSSPTAVGAGTSAPVLRHVSWVPAFFARALVRVDSPPVRTMMSAWPFWISVAAAFTNDCGVLPPIALSAYSREVTPRSFAMSHAGLPYFQLNKPTTRSASRSGSEAKPASAVAKRIASTMSATGSAAVSNEAVRGSFGRCSDWPEPTRMGVFGERVIDAG